jgi:hypothetical protein
MVKSLCAPLFYLFNQYDLPQKSTKNKPERNSREPELNHGQVIIYSFILSNSLDLPRKSIKNKSERSSREAELNHGQVIFYSFILSN